MFIASSSEAIGEEPGFMSVATAIGTPWARNRRNRRHLRFAQGVEGAGQDHRHRAAAAIALTPGSSRYSR